MAGSMARASCASHHALHSTTTTEKTYRLQALANPTHAWGWPLLLLICFACPIGSMLRGRCVFNSASGSLTREAGAAAMRPQKASNSGRNAASSLLFASRRGKSRSKLCTKQACRHSMRSCAVAASLQRHAYSTNAADCAGPGSPMAKSELPGWLTTISGRKTISSAQHCRSKGNTHRAQTDSKGNGGIREHCRA